jgi:membrane-associated protease RseP (regulator of RpoE activity)
MISITFFDLILAIGGQAAFIWFVGWLLKQLGVEFKTVNFSGPAIMWKSERGLSLIDKIAKKGKKFWEAYADFGIILAFGFLGGLYVFQEKQITSRLEGKNPKNFHFSLKTLVYSVLVAGFITFVTIFTNLIPLTEALALFFLFLTGFSGAMTFLLAEAAFQTAFGLLTGESVVAKVAPVIPGVRVKGAPITFPWYGWLAFPLLLVFHEVSHGILARVGGVKVDSTGLFTLGLFPGGAFVEPDEKQLEKSDLRTKLRVFAVGSTSNYVTAMLFLAVLLAASIPLSSALSQYPTHPELIYLEESSNAPEGFSPGSKIISINGTVLNSTTELSNVTEAIGAGNPVLLVTDKGSFVFDLTSEAKIGGVFKDSFHGLPPELELWSTVFTFWMMFVFFSAVIGVMNLLPFWILDGGLMVKAFFKEFCSARIANRLALAITVVITLFFVVNVLPLFLV